MNGDNEYLDDPRWTAYALGETEGDERAKFDALVANDPELARHVADIRAAGAALEQEFAAAPRLELDAAQRARIAAVAGGAEHASVRSRSIAWRAAAVALIGLGGAWWLMSGPTLEPNKTEVSKAGTPDSGPSGQPVAKDDIEVEEVEPREDRSVVPGAPIPDPSSEVVRIAGESPEAENRDRFVGVVVKPHGALEPGISGLPRFGTLGQRHAGVPSTEGAESDALRSARELLEFHNSTTVQPDQDVVEVYKRALEDLARSGVNPAYENETRAQYEYSFGLARARSADNAESYAPITENTFALVKDAPLSTFSTDVDTASYANMRRMLREGAMPPPDSIRIEELVNYFSYSYPGPTGDDPFSIDVEVAGCPWQPEHRLARIALRGKDIEVLEPKVRNLVFLIDVSGSMDSPEKLPLLKHGMKLLVENLDSRDRVAIVTYAGSSGCALEPTPCNERSKILDAIERLAPGGSTNGAAGIELAYQLAAQHFDKEGINRVILATDGDFNVGVSDDGPLTRLIEDKRKTGVFLSVLGFGTGNLKDSKMEALADHGNGNYAYIDSEREARKVLVEQMGGTLITIAKDVKVQIEFNPAQVAAYRLIGYENRMLAAQDFNDDRKDAGEIGAGHRVTALYQLVPAGERIDGANIDPLKYQPEPRAEPQPEPTPVASNELMTVKLRFKQPDGVTSRKLERAVVDANGEFGQASTDFRFAAAVAQFGMLLRGSKFAGTASFEAVRSIAGDACGADAYGYRAEFLELIGIVLRLGGR